MNEKLKTLKELCLINDGTLEIFDEDLTKVYIKELRDEAIKWVKSINSIHSDQEAVNFWVDYIAFPDDGKLKRRWKKIIMSLRPEIYPCILRGISAWIRHFYNVSEEDLK